MKNIIAIAATVIVIVLMLMTYNNGTAYQGGKAAHVIEDLSTYTQKQKQKQSQPKEKDVGQEKLKALRDKAGNSSTFEVSSAYKSKCASCHGSDGSGMQNGKKLMGPKLFGQSEEKLYQDLVDFKAGRKENLIMKGLLVNLTDEDLRYFAKEISEFKARQEALNQQ